VLPVAQVANDREHERRGSSVDPRLEELTLALGRDEGSRAYLEEVRWPDGVCCARCSSARVGYLRSRAKHQCRDCGFQFRVTAGTVLHDSHAPPAKWLLAVQLLLDSPDGFPAHRLQALIGGSYKTSWFVEHRIRLAMAQALRRLDSGAPVALAQDVSTHAAPADTHGAISAPDEVVRGVRLLKRAAGVSYHRPSLEHLSEYWAETRWRAANSGEDAFRRTVEALLDASPVTYREFVHSGAAPASLTN
jgi:hypothetical protein